MKIVKEPQELVEELVNLEREAYSSLVIGDFKKAEENYQRQYDLLRAREDKLPADEKYHKGSPLYNWGIALLLHNRLLDGFNKIILAYVEDLLDFSKLEDALQAPAFKTLDSYALITKELLKKLELIAKQRRETNQVPKNPEEILAQAKNEGQADLSAIFTVANIKKTPLTIETLKPLIQDQLEKLGPKEKRVFVGGSYKNMAVLRYIGKVIEEKGFKPVIPVDLPKVSADDYDHLIHDVSIEYLKGCTYAIFDVSITNGHLMEIERARDDAHLKVLLTYQRTSANRIPTITQMVMTAGFRKAGYNNFTEMTIEIGKFLEN